MRFNRNSKTVMSVPVRESGTLEVVLGQFWSSLGDASARLRVEFHGVTSTASRSICVTSTSRVRRVDLLASLRDETVSPSAVLSHAKTLYVVFERGVRDDFFSMILFNHVTYFNAITRYQNNTIRIRRPTLEHRYKPKSDGKIVVPRDRQIKGDEKCCSKMYALRLSYDVSVANDDKASGVSFGIHPLNDLLYESPFQSQLVTVRDANGKIVHHSDAWPHKYKASSLSSGTYKVDIDLRHESESVLEKFKKASLTVTQSLKSKITVPVYKRMSDAILGKTWSGSVKLSKGQSVALFLGVPSDDAVSKAVPKNFSNQVAQSLSGSVTYVMFDRSYRSLISLRINHKYQHSNTDAGTASEHS